MDIGVTWLGQSGFLLEQEGFRLLLDPYFSEAVRDRLGYVRLVAPPGELADLHPDAIAITHDHVDHFDPVALPQLHRLFPDAPIVGPVSVEEHARRLGFNSERLVKIEPGATQPLGPFRLTATPAYHSDPYAVGYLLQTQTQTLYFTGDTLWHDTLGEAVLRLAGGPPDVAFLVINGKLGNMTLTEAARLARQLQPGLSIPMHYGMFAENTADPHDFISACEEAGLAARALPYGQSVQL